MKRLLAENPLKGQPGYAANERKRRILITALLFALPLGIFFLAWYQLGTRETIWTVITAVSCLPACRSLVSVIMICRMPSVDRELYERIRAHQGRLVMAWELYLTFYEKSAFVDAAVLCGTSVVLLCTAPETDGPYICGHVRDIFQGNGYRTDVRVLNTEKAFIQRLDSMNENYASLQEGLRDRMDERYPDMSRDEILRSLLLSISL